jgi:uncharacterized protein (DUF1810 family)
MTNDEFAHFLEAQESVFGQAAAELARGEKRSHWMWFIFPQLIGLGHSQMAQRYALHSLDETRRYAAHPLLGERLRRCTRLVCALQNRPASNIFGYPDDLKFHSSMTLFVLALPDDLLFKAALDKYFEGLKDAKTLKILGAQN